MNNTIEIIDKGIKCLSDNLGENEAEQFIAALLRERFDYTEWRRILTDNIDTFEALDDFRRIHSGTGFDGAPEKII